jgi:hypothetical protein
MSLSIKVISFLNVQRIWEYHYYSVWDIEKKKREIEIEIFGWNKENYL